MTNYISRADEIFKGRRVIVIIEKQVLGHTLEKYEVIAPYFIFGLFSIIKPIYL